MKNLIVILTAVALVALPTATLANEKGAERLLKSIGAIKKTEVVSTVKKHGDCPACKSKLATATTTERGNVKVTATREKHLCSSCGTKFEIRGVGKTAKVTPKHLCAACQK